MGVLRRPPVNARGRVLRGTQADAGPIQRASHSMASTDSRAIGTRGIRESSLVKSRNRPLAAAIRPRVRVSLLKGIDLSLIHISEPTRLGMISYAVFCLKK